MNNEEKVEAAKKDAGGDEKLIIKFAWPYSPFYSRIKPWFTRLPAQCMAPAWLETQNSGFWPREREQTQRRLYNAPISPKINCCYTVRRPAVQNNTIIADTGSTKFNSLIFNHTLPCSIYSHS